MVIAMTQDEDTQLSAMASFVKSVGLADALRAGDWSAFAFGYNGRDYRNNHYDELLAGTHARFSILHPDLTYRTAQTALLYLGFNPGSVDGIPGKVTRGALAKFQWQSSMPATGELDDETVSMLMTRAFAP